MLRSEKMTDTGLKFHLRARIPCASRFLQHFFTVFPKINEVVLIFKLSLANKL